MKKSVRLFLSTFIATFLLFANSFHNTETYIYSICKRQILKPSMEINTENLTNKPTIIPGVGNEGCLIKSPSGINTLPLSNQAIIVANIFLGLFLSTYGLVSLFDYAMDTYPTINYTFSAWEATWLLLGPIFMLAGIAHFVIDKEFMNIVPPNGTWGFWFVPGGKRFHVYWTGVAEFILGSLLSVGGISQFFGVALPSIFFINANELVSASSFGLLVLTIMMTPANIYMYTHGARLPMSAPQVC
jgi:uncharacterized membrane protein